MNRRPVNWTPEKIERFWSLISEDPDFSSLYFTKMAGVAVIRLLNSHFPLRGKRILDYGCGPGFLLEAIARLNIDCQYVGVDFSSKSVAVLAERGRGYQQFRKAVQINSLDNTIGEAFDAIVCCEVVEHLDQEFLDKLVAFFKRHLRPGGVILFTTPNRENLGLNSAYCPDCGAYFHRWQHLRSWSRDSLDAYLSGGGLKDNLLLELEISNSPVEQWLRTTLFKVLGRVPGNLICISRT